LARHLSLAPLPYCEELLDCLVFLTLLVAFLSLSSIGLETGMGLAKLATLARTEGRYFQTASPTLLDLLAFFWCTLLFS